MSIDSSQLPESLRERFAKFPTFTEEKREILRKAAARLDRDPGFQSDFLKSKFVSAMMGAMESLGINQSALAGKWGRTRQYISKLFNEDKRVNFAIDTMVECAMILNRGVELNFPELSETKPKEIETGSQLYSIIPNNIVPFPGALGGTRHIPNPASPNTAYAKAGT